MADVFVEFGRDFQLRLDNGAVLNFKKGPQRIDEALLTHWFVQGQRVDVNPATLIGPGGSKDFLKEDLEIARRLMEEETASRERVAKLNALRTRAVAVKVQNVISAQQHIDWDSLTPAQRVLLEGAKREEAKRQKQLADELLGTIENAEAKPPAVEITPLGDAQAAQLPLPEAKTTKLVTEADIPDDAQVNGEPPKPAGRPKI